MKPALLRMATSPLGAVLSGLLFFFVTFFFFGSSVSMTLLVFLAAAVGLIILIRPEIGLYLLVLNAVASFAQYFNLPRLGPITLPLALEGILLLAFMMHVSLLRRPLYLNLPENWLLACYMILAVLSMLMADHSDAQNVNQFRSNHVIVVAVFFLVTNLVRNMRTFLHLIGVIVASDLILVLSGVLNYVGLLEARMDAPERIAGRTVGIIGNPNALAFALIGLLPFIIGFILYSRKPGIRLALLGLAAGNLFVILNTLSRGGFITLAAVILIMAFRVSRDRRLIALFLLLGLITYLLLPAALFDRFEEVESLQGNTRWVLTVIGVHMALDNPIFGVGYGNFRRYFPRYDVFNQGGAAAPHNMYTSIAAQTGLPSLLLFLTFLGLIWRRQSRLIAVFRDQGERFFMLLAVALQASLAHILLFGLSANIETDYLIYVVTALTVVLDRLSRRSESGGERFDPVEPDVAALPAAPGLPA